MPHPRIIVKAPFADELYSIKFNNKQDVHTFAIRVFLVYQWRQFICCIILNAYPMRQVYVKRIVCTCKIGGFQSVPDGI